MTKKVRGIISGVVIVIIIVVGIYLYMGQNQKNVLLKEMEGINTTQQIDMTIKTTGKYAQVEKALKEYLKSYLGTIEELSNEYATSMVLTNAVSASNVKEDGPEFTKTKEEIVKLKEKENTVQSKITEMITDEYISQKADDAGLKGDMKELYIEVLNLEEDVKNIKSVISSVDKYIEKVEEILNFLTENKAQWQVSGQNILFNKSTTLAEYNVLVTSLNTIKSTLQMKITNLS